MQTSVAPRCQTSSSHSLYLNMYREKKGAVVTCLCRLSQLFTQKPLSKVRSLVSDDGIIFIINQAGREPRI